MPELTQLDREKSMIRYLPPKGMAGLARLRVRWRRRSPRPPAITTAMVLLVSWLTKRPDFLGFTVDWEHRYSPDLPLYLQLSLGGAVVHLSQHYGDASPGAKVMVHMGGLAGYHARLSAKQYRFARPGLVDEPWGAVTMTVHDPFSNRLVFTEFR